MNTLVNHPIFTFAVTVAVLWASSRVGAALRTRRIEMLEEERTDFGVLLAAMLTLLGILIGFSFSMTGSRYDQRKNFEENEANAIGTEYLRADLLSNDTADKVRALLRGYLDQRILFYTTANDDQLRQINGTTTTLQAELWDAVKAHAGTDRSAIEALTVSGMNDVLNSQAYTQAAWWNRLPIGAWGLMWVIAVCCNVMIGFYIRPNGPRKIRFVMPIVIAVTFFLMADIDSPRRGIIRVRPQNLTSLAASLGPR